MAARHPGPVLRLPDAGVGQQVQAQPRFFAFLQEASHARHRLDGPVPFENQGVGSGVKTARQPREHLLFQFRLSKLS